MNYKIYTKDYILFLELYSIHPGFSMAILSDIKALLHLVKRPFCLVFDFHQLDEQALKIPSTETDGFIQIIEILDRVGRTHAVWIYGEHSYNHQYFAQLMEEHSIAYTKSQRAHSLSEAELIAQHYFKTHHRKHK